MNRLFKILGIGLIALSVLVGVLFLALVVYNIGDEKLDPEVTKLLAMSPPQIPAEKNGYFAWIGVVGPETESPHAWGQRWVEQARAADAKASFSDDETAKLAIDAEKREETLDAKTVPCKDPNTCLEEVAADPERARAALAAGAVTLARADSALDYPTYQEAWRSGITLWSVFPSHPPLWRQVSATRFALDVSEGHHDRALEGMAREVAFHTRQMQGAALLIEKIVALSYLRDDYRLLNRYLLTYPVEARQREERLATMLAPLPAEATQMKFVSETECRVFIRMLLTRTDEILARGEIDDGESPARKWISKQMTTLFYHPNATANAFYRALRPVIEADDKVGAAYRGAFVSARNNEDQGQISLENPPLSNPIGRIMLTVGLPSYESYFFRRDDLLMLRAAVALQFDLLRRGVTDSEAISRKITAARLEHPFTGQAPKWHVDSRTLVFAALSERRNEALTIAF